MAVYYNITIANMRQYFFVKFALFFVLALTMQT